MTAPDELDRDDVRLARSAQGLLRVFNEAGVIVAADVHVALRLGRLAGEDDPAVLLAVALAVRAPRLGSVFADLATIAESVTPELEGAVDAGALPWPPAPGWATRVAASALAAEGDDEPAARPLRLLGTALYLDRYWRDERRVAADLAARAEEAADGLDEAVLADGLERLFGPDDPDLQRLAAATALLRRLAVVAGGPGTGKTTTVTRIVALLEEQARAASAPAPLVALAAPTGKAAARLAEAVHEEARRLDVSEDVRGRLLALSASTLHRLLGSRPGAARFRHGPTNRLPHDLVVVDETSMVSLSLMARLLEAVGHDTRLVLVGDPEQLSSVEAGAVLGDVVGPAADGMAMRAPARERLARIARREVPAELAPTSRAIGDGIVVLRRSHRFGGDIAALAEAVRGGRADEALDILRGASRHVRLVEVDLAADPPPPAVELLRERALPAARRLLDTARDGDGRAALHALGAFRILCAHRRGPYGVAAWNARVEAWLGTALDRPGEGGWYVGRPLLVTENDYGLRLWNGDTGVVVAAGEGRASAVFERAGGLVGFSPERLEAVETVHAMTIHKSQGSQLEEVAVLLPDPGSRVLSRELLYTAVTRASRRVAVFGTEEALRAAVERPAARASGLAARLWG